MLPLELFKNKIRFGAYLTRLLFMMTMLPFWYFLPQMMQTVYGFSPFEAGLAFLPLTIINFLVALQLPMLVNKYGNNKVLFIGEIILLIGLIILGISSIDKGYIHSIFIPMIILGLGQGLILAPVTSAGVHNAPANLTGVASGITNTMHQIGGPIGLSLIIMTTTNFKTEIWMMVIFTIIAMFIVSLLLLERTKSE
ncbi:MFS transporter [Lactococcus lactis]|uniref:MFS transporter n=1 Tax=Lactococcus lactis TaxID=1358 RepID=UPI0030FF1450